MKNGYYERLDISLNKMVSSMAQCKNVISAFFRKMS